MRADRRGPGVALIIAAILAMVAGCTSQSVAGQGGPADPSSTAGGGPAASETGQGTASGHATASGDLGTQDGGTDATAGGVSAGDPADSGPASPPAPTVSSSEPITSSTAPSTTVVPPVATVTSTPKAGSAGLNPIEPITVRVTKGTISDIALTNPTGYHVKGTLSKDGHSWTTAEVLGYGKTYTLSGTAVGTDGKKVRIAGRYTMLTPKTEVRTTVYPTDDMTVGVAMPIMVKFAVEPEDRALIERNVSVTTEPEVEGAWAWIHHDGGIWGLDFRPKGYWPEGTKVHVEAHMYGLRFGEGAYGETDITSDFTIGRNQVVYADSDAHQMVVTQDGETIATYPASFGSDTPDRQTRSGIHVVTEKFTDKRMVSEQFGYDVMEKWAVRISDNGEFIHANPNTVAEQGNTNVSHGCINLSTENAKAYYDSVLPGDPVEVSGTDVQLGPQDGDIFDYAIGWQEWLSLSALR